MFQRVVCNLQDLLVCRVCINYPGTLPYKHNFTKWLILDSWVTTRCSSDGFVSEEMMMNSSGLPGQLLLPRWQISIISIILHTSDYCFLAGRSWWVINSRVQSIQDPHPGILNHLFIRFGPICNCRQGKLSTAIIREWDAALAGQHTVCRPGRCPGSWQSLEEGWGRCHVNWFNANKDSHHHDRSHPEPSKTQCEERWHQQCWHLHKRLRIWRYIFRRVE